MALNPASDQPRDNQPSGLVNGPVPMIAVAPPPDQNPTNNNSGSVPRFVTQEIPGNNAGYPKKMFMALGVLLLLLTAVPLTLFLVKQRQDIRNRAAGCDMRWPTNPDSVCGNTTLVPKNGAIGVSLMPNFHWDYGGYRPEDNGQCIQPSGCTGYYVNVYLWEGSPVESNLVAVCGVGSSVSAIKDAPFSCFRTNAGNGPPLTTLKPNTTYWWRPAPGTNETGAHAEQSWNYTFTTGSTATPTPTPSSPPDAVGMCLFVKAFDNLWTQITNLSTITVGQVINFTANGSTNDPAGITKARFQINSAADASWCTGAGNTLSGSWCETTNKQGADFYVTYTITASGSFTVNSMVFNPTLGWK